MAADETIETFAFLPRLDTDGTPYVQLTWRDQDGAFTTTAARRAALSLLEAAEQAELEHEMWTWLLGDAETQGTPLDEARVHVAKIIATFRQHRDEPAPFIPGSEDKT